MKGIIQWAIIITILALFFGWGATFDGLMKVLGFIFLGFLVTETLKAAIYEAIYNNTKINEIEKVQHRTFNLLIKIEKDLQQLKYK